MEITDEVLSRFNGGQIETRVAGDNSVDVAQIGSIWLAVWLKVPAIQANVIWVARGDSFPPRPSVWRHVPECDGHEYSGGSEHYSFNEVGDGRAAFTTQHAEYGIVTAILIPPGHPAILDPSQVQGLQLYTSQP